MTVILLFVGHYSGRRSSQKDSGAAGVEPRLGAGVRSHLHSTMPSDRTRKDFVFLSVDLEFSGLNTVVDLCSGRLDRSGYCLIHAAPSAFMNCFTPSRPVKPSLSDPPSRSSRMSISKKGQQTRSPIAHSVTS